MVTQHEQPPPTPAPRRPPRRCDVGELVMHDSTCMIFDADPIQQHFARWMCTSAVRSLLGCKKTLGLVIA